jgi:hypothetical protein
MAKIVRELSAASLSRASVGDKFVKIPPVTSTWPGPPPGSFSLAEGREAPGFAIVVFLQQPFEKAAMPDV